MAGGAVLACCVATVQRRIVADKGQALESAPRISQTSASIDVRLGLWPNFLRPCVRPSRLVSLGLSRDEPNQYAGERKQPNEHYLQNFLLSRIAMRSCHNHRRPNIYGQETNDQK